LRCETFFVSLINWGIFDYPLQREQSVLQLPFFIILIPVAIIVIVLQTFITCPALSM